MNSRKQTLGKFQNPIKLLSPLSHVSDLSSIMNEAYENVFHLWCKGSGKSHLSGTD